MVRLGGPLGVPPNSVKMFAPEISTDIKNTGIVNLAVQKFDFWGSTLGVPRGVVPSGGSRKFWWGGFEAKTSKIRMSSPKLRVIFSPKSEIQTFFSPKIRWSPKKKKKKVFTKIETDFLAEIGNSNVFFAQNQVVSKEKKKKGLHQN